MNEYYFYWYEAFWKPQSHETLYSKWTILYHCGELCSSSIRKLIKSKAKFIIGQGSYDLPFNFFHRIYTRRITSNVQYKHNFVFVSFKLFMDRLNLESITRLLYKNVKNEGLTKVEN